MENLLQSVPLLTRTVKQAEPKVTRREKKQKKKEHVPMKQKVVREPKRVGSATPAAAETVLFNKLAFTDADTKAAKKNRMPKNPKQALAAVERKREKLSALRERDPSLAKAAEGKDAWSKAIDRAQGTVVRDDPRLLKRSLARMQKEKERGKKRWEERVEKMNYL
ncbi:putative surfeit locus protein 6 [Paramicrosporidium saccamoebae]|uniref:Putative surfeit locus protein 6 n=1 Tax=Paramicrosporidium saccamoebae TaxID=1246581 RepID=A0A2H9TJT9_9FUNG|nr:putative surfeit locus protein 6 [Paramicrosporidium saccamoebae]